MEIALGTNLLRSRSHRALVAVNGARLLVATGTEGLPQLGLNLYEPDGTPLARVVKDELRSSAAEGLVVTCGSSAFQLRDAHGRATVEAAKLARDRVEISYLDVYGHYGLRVYIANGAMQILKDGVLLATVRNTLFQQDRLALAFAEEDGRKRDDGELVVSLESKGMTIVNSTFG